MSAGRTDGQTAGPGRLKQVRVLQVAAKHQLLKLVRHTLPRMCLLPLQSNC